MKKYTIQTLMVLAILSFWGCQKTADTPVQTAEAPAIEAENAAAQDSANENRAQIPDTANSAQEAHKTLQNHTYLDKFNQYHLPPDILTPEFATDILTKNGDFANTLKGHFVYFDINQALTIAEFSPYIQKIFAHVQSTAQDHAIYRFDINTQSRGETISSVEPDAIDAPVQFSWQNDGRWYALYVHTKDYAPGIFSGISEPHKALYLTVIELP